MEHNRFEDEKLAPESQALNVPVIYPQPIEAGAIDLAQFASANQSSSNYPIVMGPDFAPT